MARYVALLRGVNNIGASKRVAMADLRALFERLRFRDVATVLNSGSVVFSAPPSLPRSAVLARIEKGLTDELRLTATVTLLSGSDVAAAVRENPFVGPKVNPSHLLVVVPRKKSDLALVRPLLAERWTPERLAVGTRVAYVWCARGVPRSPLWMAVDRALARTGTVRNIATVTKALALVEGSGRKIAGARGRNA